MKSRVRGGIFLSFWTGLGVYFALFPPPLCLFDDHGENDIERIELPEFTDEVWHGCGLCSQPRARRQERSTGMRAACAIRRTRKKGALTHSEARILRTRLQRSAPLRDQQAETLLVLHRPTRTSSAGTTATTRLLPTRRLCQCIQLRWRGSAAHRKSTPNRIDERCLSATFERDWPEFPFLFLQRAIKPFCAPQISHPRSPSGT